MKKLAKQIDALTKGKQLVVPAKIEISEKPKPSHQGAVYVKKGGKGGARPNAGKAPLPAIERRRTLKQSWQDFGLEDIEVKYPKQLEKGTVVERRIKMKRIRVIQETTFNEARKGNITAIKEFNDRVLGKSPQPIVGDEEEDPIRFNLGIGRILEKAYDPDANPEEDDTA